MVGCAGVVQAAAVFIDGVMAIAKKEAATTNYSESRTTLYLNNGDRYEGSFSRDVKNGSGT
jgi:hypothetical protein